MMRMGWKGTVVLALGLVGVGTAVAPHQVDAQDPEHECRCVDRGGTELEDCFCVRMPDVERIVMRSLAGLERPRIGISVIMTEPSAQAEGARIVDVLEDGPADRAGLREGDIVTRLNGHALTAPLDAESEQELDADGALAPQRLLALMKDIDAGDQVELEYLRDGQTARTTVEAAELEGLARFAPSAQGWDAGRFESQMRALGDRMRMLPSPMGPDTPHAPRIFRFEGERGDGPVWFDLRGPHMDGLDLVRVNPELGGYFGTDRGVLVTAIPEGSALGLRAGDVILEIDGRTVEDPERVRAILASYDPDEAVSFRIRRDGQAIDVSGRVGGRGGM